MTLTNCYTTLAELKRRLMQQHTYTAATIGFTTGTKVIADTMKGLKRFQTGDFVKISGSVSNNGYFTVATGNVAAQIVVSETVATEAAGATVTISSWNDLTDDAILEQDITAASRWIEELCGRRFYRNSADEDRYYRAEDADRLAIDDMTAAPTTLVTDADGDRTYETTWAATDYDLFPYNAGLDGVPYTRLETTPAGRYAFPTDMPRGVKITGKFGYSATTPPAVAEACLILAAQLFKRKDTPQGVSGNAELGVLRVDKGPDPHALALLRPYMRLWLGAI